MESTARRWPVSARAVSGGFALLFAAVAVAHAHPERDAGTVLDMRGVSGESDTAAPRVRIELFGRAGCPHCERARRFLGELEASRDDLEVVEHDVVRDASSLARLESLAASSRLRQVAVPAIYVRGRLLVGFDEAAGGRERVVAALRGASLPAGESGGGVCTTADAGREGCPDASSAQPESVELPLFGTFRERDVGLPLFTLALGLVDGFNPCAMWVLLFLLSMLVNVHDRRRMALVAGVFLVVSGLVYYAFMAAWLGFFAVLGAARWLQIVLGVVAIAAGSVHVKDFFAFRRGVTLSIPESAKPGIYARVRRIVRAESTSVALLSAVTLAVMVNVVELVCTAGLPVVYTQVLAAHDLVPWKQHAYLALYNVAYMFDDTVMVVIALVTMSRRKLEEKGGRLLKLVSGLVLVGLGLLLLVRPEWLAFGVD